MAKKARKPVRKAAAKPAKKTTTRKTTAAPKRAASKSTKQSVTIRLDSDVVAWFKKKADKYQTEINSVLRQYATKRGL